MKYFVYILYSEKLDKYYIGSTGDLEDRLKKHNRSRSGFTSMGKPWIMVYNEVLSDKTVALKREKQLKAWKHLKLSKMWRKLKCLMHLISLDRSCKEFSEDSSTSTKSSR